MEKYLALKSVKSIVQSVCERKLDEKLEELVEENGKVIVVGWSEFELISVLLAVYKRKLAGKWRDGDVFDLLVEKEDLAKISMSPVYLLGQDVITKVRTESDGVYDLALFVASSSKGIEDLKPVEGSGGFKVKGFITTSVKLIGIKPPSLP